MRKIYWFLVLALTACTSAQINQTIGEVNKAMGTTPAEKPLTTAEVGDGLKEALVNGISKGADLVLSLIHI